MQRVARITTSAYAASASILLTVALTVGAELSPLLKVWLTGFMGHHWTSKSIISVVVYGVLFVLLQQVAGEGAASASAAKRALNILLQTTVVSLIAVIGFFVAEYFHWF